MLFIRIVLILTVLSNIGLYIYTQQNIPKHITFKPVDPGVEKLVLLSELDTQSTIWESEKQPEKDDRNTEEAPFNQQCFSIGSFKSKPKTIPVLDSLKTHVLKIRTRKVTSSQEAGYWVYIPAMSTREQALETGRQLSQYNVKDYYVVTGGENENTISLGLYREIANADARLQELRSLGFDAQKQVRIEQWPEFWLDFTIASDQLQNLPDITEINPDVEINEVECNW